MLNLKRNPLAAAVSGILVLGAPATLAQGMLEEVVVTAQKREQSVSDLGLSVTAFTGDAMRSLGWSQPKDLAAQTPGLIINNTMGDSQPAVMIRGVGINDFNTNTNPGVGVYVDEVVKPIPAMLGFALFDMDRVEVLKGPQGTLYGQNTTGGAVSFHTNQPGEELEGYVSGDLGNYDSYSIEAGIGGAITDNLRGRISGITSQRNEGYLEDVLTGDEHGEMDRSALRAQLAMDLGDSVEATVRYTHGEDKSDNAFPAVAEGLEVMQAYYYTFYDGSQSNLDHLDIIKGDSEAFLDNEYDSYGLTVTADLGFATLTSVTGYDEMDHRNVLPFQGTELRMQNADYRGEVESLSQEFRLTSNEGELVDWILGLYYGEVKQDNESALDMTDGFGYIFFLEGLTTVPEYTQVITDYDQKLTTMAVFGHTEWHLSDQFKLTVGARYAQDDLDYDVTVGSVRTPACTGALCDIVDLYYGLTDYDSAFSTFLNVSDGGQFDGVRSGGIFAQKSESVDENSFTWRLGLDWTPNDDALFYGNIASGTKAHGFYGGLATTGTAYGAYDPEDIMSYELGFKLALLDQTMQLNGAVFSALTRVSVFPMTYCRILVLLKSRVLN
jgi:iron complex outermembrane recepter protein